MISVAPTFPAGLVDGRQEFFFDGETNQVLKGGTVRPAFEDDPESVKIIEADMNRRPSALWSLDDMGLTDPAERLQQYTTCVLGGFDGRPDIVDGQVVHNEYWDCGQRGKCKYEGKLCCSIQVGTQRITLREIEMVKEICSGAPDKQIADNMGISLKTLNPMKRRLCEKIGGQTKLDIINFALRHNIHNSNVHS